MQVFLRKSVLVYSQMMEYKELLHKIIPPHCSKDDKCNFYRNATPAWYAKVFLNFQKKITLEQYLRFMSMLIIHFGRSANLERCGGKTILSPVEQKIVLWALHKVGAKRDFLFDKYLKFYN